jgi:hypothetical protein
MYYGLTGHNPIFGLLTDPRLHTRTKAQRAGDLGHEVEVNSHVVNWNP